MHISWMGETAIRIEAKNADESVVLLIDPYLPASGPAPRSIKTDLALLSNGTKNLITLAGEPFVMQTPGEIETKNILVFGVGCARGIMWFIETEGVTIAHLGCAGKELTSKELEILANADVILIPVGGGEFPDAEEASKIVSQIEPRIVIPFAYGTGKGEKLAPVSAFLKEIGIDAGAPESKIKIAKKDLPQDEMKVLVLEKS